MKNEQGAVLLTVLAMTAILLVMSAAAIRMTMLSRTGNSQAKAQLQQEADQLKPLLKP